jgi:hypothetical protein
VNLPRDCSSGLQNTQAQEPANADPWAAI